MCVGGGLSESNWGRPEIVFHDPLAAALIFEPSLCRTRACRIEVELMDERRLGRTRPAAEAASKPHRVAYSVEVAAFFEHYFSIVGGRLARRTIE